MLYVCSLSRLTDTVERTGASHVVTLINANMPVETPSGVAAENHLVLHFNDIPAPVKGLVPPAEADVRSLLDFVRAWDQKAPLVIHCWAGVSRSTAGAYVSACALRADACEYELAQTLRLHSPSATPNARLVALGDKLLGRNGRMIEAIKSIGRGADTFEGAPFVMPLDGSGKPQT